VFKKLNRDFYEKLEGKVRKKETASKKALAQLEVKVTLASQILKRYESLPAAPESKMAALPEAARKDRQQAKRCEYRNPPLAQSLLEAAHSREQQYLLWCDYHGKAPTKALAGVALDDPAEPPRVRGRGGRRPNAGRPALGHVQVLLKCQPETADKLRALAQAEGVTLGGWLDAHLNSIVRPEKAI
jgi:hypothetical protein